jgi:hypothetical protein
MNDFERYKMDQEECQRWYKYAKELEDVLNTRKHFLHNLEGWEEH